MAQPVYTAEQLDKLMKNHSKGITEFRDGEQWVKYGTLTEMGELIDKITLSLFPPAQAKPVGYIRARCVKGYQR